MIGPERLREIEPHCAGIRAIWSPNTGIVDYGRVAQSYAEDIREFNGEIRTRHEVTAIERRGGSRCSNATLRWMPCAADTSSTVTASARRCSDVRIRRRVGSARA